MNNFFYFFIFSLLVLNEWEIYYARELNLRSLENLARDIIPEQWENSINRFHVKRSPKVKFGSKSGFSKRIPDPFAVFLQNEHPDDSGYTGKITGREFTKRRIKRRKGVNKRTPKLKRKKRKRIKKNAKNLKRYLDYSNSQMPFNEGKKRCNKVDEKILKAKETDKKNSECDKKYESNLVSRYEDLQDDVREGYSRVRRFLDRERAKKMIPIVNTLDEKEAAMSRVLDPNLNLDGILEPHVRKRREKHEWPALHHPKK